MRKASLSRVLIAVVISWLHDSKHAVSRLLVNVFVVEFRMVDAELFLIECLSW